MTTSDDIPRAGLEAEYHADDAFLPAVGGRIASWTDQSGLGRNLVQANAALRPIAADAGGIWAGRKCVRFTAANSEYMETAAFTLAQPTTVVTVFRNRAPGASGIKDIIWGGRGAVAVFQSTTTGGVETQLYPGTAGLTWNGTSGSNGFCVATGTVNGASSTIDINAVRVAGPGGLGVAAPSGLALASMGTAGGGGPGRYTDIDVFCLLIYSRVLSLEEIAQVTYLLGARYGIDVNQPLRESLACECYSDDASVPAVGSTVASWTDLSGNANNPTQVGAVGLRPTVVEDSGKSLNFDGIDDFLTAAYALVQPCERIGLLRWMDVAPSLRTQWDGTTVNRGQLQIDESATIIADGDMEGAGLGPWNTLAGVTTKEPGTPYSGLQCIRSTSAGGGAYFFQNVLTVGRRYRVRGWVRGDGTVNRTPGFYAGGTVWVPVATNANVWQYFDAIVVAVGGTNMYFGSVGVVGGWVEFDDLVVTLLGTSIQAGTLLYGEGYAARSKYSVLDALYNGASSVLYEDGEARTAVGNAGANAPAGVMLGANATPAEWSNCRYKAFLDYRRALAANERTRVRGYLARRFALNGELLIPSFGLQAGWLWTGLPAVGALVDTWTDISVWGRNLTAAGAARPTVVDVGGGRKAARFDGAANILRSPAFATAQPLTMYLVARATTQAGNTKVIVDGLNAGRVAFYYQVAGFSGMYAGLNLWAVPPRNVIFPDFKTLTLAYNNAATTSFFVNNILDASTGAGNIGANNSDGIVVGAFNNGGGAPSLFWDGDVMALLVYSGTHTAAERARIVATLEQLCRV